MEWADETILRLRALWDEGLSTREIGGRLGLTKNAVVGKAHRLGLPSRPSPIQRNGPPGERKPRQPRRVAAGTSTLPQLGSVATLKGEPITTPTDKPPSARPLLVTHPIVIEKKLTVPALRPYGRIITCCFPIGEPGTTSFKFCNDPSEPGKVYCMVHCRRSYVKVRDRRDEADDSDAGRLL